MKAKPIPKCIAQFMGNDPLNALFVYEALNRYAQYVMDLDPKDHERSIDSLCMVQQIAQDWYDITHEPIKAKIGEAQKI